MLRASLRQPRRVAVVAVILLAAACAPASAGPPTERLREFFARVNGVLSDPATEGQPLERLERIRRMVGDLADMRAAAADVLAGSWETRTPAERDEFATLFAALLERAYVARFAGAVRGRGHIAPAYVGETVTGKDATVAARLPSGGRELNVEFRMTAADGRWRVRDVSLDGVSTVANYRAQFRRVALGGGHATVVRHLRAKLAEDSLLFARIEPHPAVPPAAPAASVLAGPATREPSALATSRPPPTAFARPLPEPRPARDAGRTRVRPAVAPMTPGDRAVVAVALASPRPRAAPPARGTAAAASPVIAEAEAVPTAARPHAFGQWLVAGAFVIGTAAICRRWRTSAR